MLVIRVLVASRTFLANVSNASQLEASTPFRPEPKETLFFDGDRAALMKNRGLHVFGRCLGQSPATPRGGCQRSPLSTMRCHCRRHGRHGTTSSDQGGWVSKPTATSIITRIAEGQSSDATEDNFIGPAMLLACGRKNHTSRH